MNPGIAANIDCVGQTITQLGSNPTSIRLEQKLHLCAVCVSGLMYSASYGQAFMHDLQPMHDESLNDAGVLIDKERVSRHS